MKIGFKPELGLEFYESAPEAQAGKTVSDIELFEDLPEINAQFEDSTPKDILKWACRTFGAEMVASSSLQTQSLPLLHMISEIAPDLTIVFVDTGFHFPETLEYRTQIAELLGLQIKTVGPQIKGDDFLAIYGPLYAQSADACCFYNKIAPFQLELKKYKAWISGIRRDQTANRQSAPVVGQHPFLQVYKINPMANWTQQQIEDYIDFYELPRHPLYHQGYRSIGCQPCTVATFKAEDVRSGRWPGLGKNECGMHRH